MRIASLAGFLPFQQLKTNSGTKITGYLALSLSILAGSTGTPFAKQLSGYVSPLSLLALSETIAVLFTVLSFGFFPLASRVLKIRKKLVPTLLLVMISNSIAAPLLVFKGISLTTAVNAELFLSSHILFLFALSCIVLREKVERVHIIAACSIVLGITVVGLRGFTAATLLSRGDILILLGSFMYASGGILFKARLSKLDPEVVIFCRSLGAITFFLLVSPFLNLPIQEELRAFPIVAVSALIGYALISRLLSLFSYYESLERLKVTTVSLFLPLSTVGSICFARLYLGEPILWYHIVGGILIVVGAVIIQYSHAHFRGESMIRFLRHDHRRHV